MPEPALLSLHLSNDHRRHHSCHSPRRASADFVAPIGLGLLLGLLLMLAAAAVTEAQVPSGTRTATSPAGDGAADGEFSSSQEVVVTDVMVEAGRLTAGQLEVVIGGETVLPVGLEAVRDGETASEPWSLVLYFDLVSSTEEALRHAARLLARQAGELVARGGVEVVLADEVPMVVLPSTRNPGLLADFLIQLAGPEPEPEESGLAALATRLGGDAADAPRERSTNLARGEVFALRSAFLREAADRSPDELEELSEAMAREEQRILGRRMDLLLDFLASRTDPTPRRAAFLVSSGFDLEPWLFYDSHTASAAPSKSPGKTLKKALETSLAPQLTKLSTSLAAYGWVLFPILPPPQDDGLEPGLRVGKWRLTGASPLGLAAEREHMRDPQRAEGWLALGDAHLEADSFEQAKDAYEKALYHFAGDPRTAPRQARAVAGLGRALEGLGRKGEARQARARAVALDPSLVTDFPETRGAPRLPTEALEEIAAHTRGALLVEEAELVAALAALRSRRRLTYPLPMAEKGSESSGEAATSGLVPLTVRPRGGGEALPAPSHARRGTPAAVRAARARRLLAGDAISGGLRVSHALSPADPLSTLRLWVEPVRPECRPSPERPLQPILTVVFGSTDTVLGEEAHTMEARPPPNDGGLIELALPLRITPGSERLAFELEDQGSGCWGGGLVRLAN